MANVINGTAGNDYLVGTDLDDIIDGKGGDYNQVDLKGRASDYTFKRNADGTITVSGATTGTDLLKGINGFWFYGENKWYSADQLAPVVTAPPAGGGSMNRIAGTAGADWLSDTNANDEIKAGDGNDTIFLGGKGNDVVDGEGGGYNQVDLMGRASDYVFKRRAAA